MASHIQDIASELYYYRERFDDPPRSSRISYKRLGRDWITTYKFIVGKGTIQEGKKLSKVNENYGTRANG